MRFHSFALTVLVTAGHTEAWVIPAFVAEKMPLCSNSSQRMISFVPMSSFLRTPSLSSSSSSRLHSTVAAEDFLETHPPKEEGKYASPKSTLQKGKPIAKGCIVSAFRGGLVAARIDDDHTDMTITKANNLQVADSIPSLVNGPTNSSNTLGGDFIGRQVQFDNGQIGVVVSHRPPIVFVYSDDAAESYLSSSETSAWNGSVTVFDNLLRIQFPQNLIQTDCFGNNVASSDYNVVHDNPMLQRPIFSPIPQVKDIALINRPLVTGVTMFDALAPIGKGQNMLFIGHDMENMRRYVTDILSIQTKEKPVTKCIYALTGTAQDQEQVKSLLQSAGLDKRVTMVATKGTNSSDMMKDEASNAAEATVVAAAACAIAETYALEEGMDTLVVIDNLDQHKKLWDTTTRVLVDVFGVDSVVKSDLDGGASSEMRAFFSSLVQRSAQYKTKRGGGSVTLLLLQSIPKISADNDEEHIFSPEDFEQSPDKIKERIQVLVRKKIPLTAANLRKIQIPVPSAREGMRRLALQHVDDLISMSDGQIWLDERLEQAGRCPAMDFQRSVTRIGIGADTNSRADSAAMRRVVEGLRLDLSQAESMGGAESATNASKQQMRSAQAWLLAMHQPTESGARKLSESCVAMLAAATGALNDSIDQGVLPGTAKGDSLIRELLSHVCASAPAAMNEIDSTLDFAPETKSILEEAIQSFFGDP